MLNVCPYACAHGGREGTCQVSSLSVVYSPETESLSEPKYQVGQLINEHHLSPHTTTWVKDIYSPALPFCMCRVFELGSSH